MNSYLQDNPRLLVLIVGLIAVSGCVALTTLPRMEDPRLTPRVARVTTVLPGSNAERVEALVTEKLERAIREVEEVKEIRSSSSSNVSFIAVELHDDVDEVGTENAWARIRDQIEDARRELPSEALAPEFTKFDITASAVILALRWDLPEEPNYAILYRLIKQLRDRIDAIPGTEKTELFGEPQEEILVTLNHDAMTSMSLSPRDISRSISASDSKVSAGMLRNRTDNILLEIAGELDTLSRVGAIPIQLGTTTNFVELADVASIEKTIRLPLETKVLLKDQPAVAVGVQIQPKTRIDLWAKDLDKALAPFAAGLPQGISIDRLFEQTPYVNSRMEGLFWNLLYGAAAIFLVILFMMGWRAAWIVGLALPLVSLAVLASMKWLKIPLHQMSVTGLVISLGLMIDNAIVVVDEICQRLREGMSRKAAVRSTTSYLFLPLAGSTLTTALSFSPIILMEGLAGEFVGSIAIVAVVAVASSFLLAMTVIATIAGFGLTDPRSSGRYAHGFTSTWLTRAYGFGLRTMLRVPVLGVLLGITLPILGFVAATQLPEQFFPPSERNQFRVDLELPATSSISETEQYAKAVGAHLLADPRVNDVNWFLGKSALMFYYNVIPLRQNVPQYGQALVECTEDVDMSAMLRELQAELEPQFPKASVILRQLEQGPAFDAPIEVRIAGPDTKTLRELGDEIRLLLTQTNHVHQTNASFSESLPKVSFTVDEQQARLAGLDHVAIAQELSSSLEGITGGSIVEASEELPVRVRVSGEERGDINRVASLDLLPRISGLSNSNAANPDAANPSAASRSVGDTYRGLPLAAISQLSLEADTVSIFREDGVRMNEVKAYLDAGVLPSEALAEFRQRLASSDITLPPGYSLSYGGAEEQRDDAVGALVANMFIVVTMMITAMVISLGSFRLAALLFCVAGLSVGLGLGSLWLAGLPWGFMSMVAMMGMIGVAVNDSIVVLAGIKSLPPKDSDNLSAISDSIVSSTRHILSTTLTTIVGFTPLFLNGGDFWRPVAVSISGGVSGATVLALVMVPCAYMLLKRKQRSSAPVHHPATDRPTLALHEAV